jgi:uncharacterized protein YjbJ (UPF0337 family)
LGVLKFEVHYTKGDPKGKEVDKAKGKIAGRRDLTGNKDLKKKGKADERAGKVKGRRGREGGLRELVDKVIKH